MDNLLAANRFIQLNVLSFSLHHIGNADHDLCIGQYFPRNEMDREKWRF